MSEPTSCCGNMDWTGCDMTQEHHPECPTRGDGVALFSGGQSLFDPRNFAGLTNSIERGGGFDLTYETLESNFRKIEIEKEPPNAQRTATEATIMQEQHEIAVLRELNTFNFGWRAGRIGVDPASEEGDRTVVRAYQDEVPFRDEFGRARWLIKGTLHPYKPIAITYDELCRLKERGAEDVLITSGGVIGELGRFPALYKSPEDAVIVFKETLERYFHRCAMGLSFHPVIYQRNQPALRRFTLSGMRWPSCYYTISIQAVIIPRDPEIPDIPASDELTIL